jgi:O-antigen/teichoic acid export membrane protein
VENFGLIGFSMSYVMIFQVIVEFGFMISATASIAINRSNSEKVSEIVSTIMYAKIILAAASAVLFFISALFVPMLREHLLIVSLFFISAILSAMLPDFFFRGIEKMKTITIRTVIIKSLSLLLIVLFVHDEAHIILIPISFIVGNFLAVFATFVAMEKTGVKLRRVQAKDALQSIRESLLFFLSRLAVSVNQSLGAFFLGLRFTPTSFETGIFSGASRLSMAGEMMLPPMTDSIYPHMINKKDYLLFYKALIVGTLLWLVLCVLVFIFARQACSIILGPDYAVAGDYLRVLLFGNFIAFPNMMLGYNALSPIGQAKHANIAILIAAGINVVACTTLWAMDSISLMSICVVLTLSNLWMLIYRGSMFIHHKNKVL